MTKSWGCSISVFFLHQVILNLCLVGNLRVTAKNCSARWFGENCLYMCRYNNEDCDDDGTCPGECKNRYFGPGCQYKNNLAQRSVEGTEAYLIDHDHTTCNPSSTATSVEISLDKTSKFAFLRIFSKNAEKLLNFRTLLNGNISCLNERKYPIDNFVDVQCENNVNINKVVFEGPIAAYVCSVYLTVGRYLSAVHNIFLRNASTEANTLFNNSCSHNEGEKYSWWSLIFQRPVMAIEIMIFNPKYIPAYEGFIVEVLTIENVRFFIYEENQNEINAIYSIKIHTYYVIKSVAVYLKNSTWNENVDLCNSQIYGEVVCPQGEYGLWCEKKCTCNENEMCNALTGVCAKGCELGYYGAFCSIPCSTNCADNTCLNPLGVCSKCIPGCEGDYCDMECEQDGSIICSETCTDGCIYDENNCLCLEKKRGQLCNDCLEGTFGINSTEQCPDECMDSRCYKTSGLCVSCYSDKRHGSKCQSICSDKCINGTCDQDTGYCLICPSGFYGPNCEIKYSDPISPSILLLILFYMLIFLAVLYFCTRKKKRKNKIRGENL